MDAIVKITPNCKMNAGEIAYVDGDPIGRVIDVNDDGTVDVLLTPGPQAKKNRTFEEAYGMHPDKMKGHRFDSVIIDDPHSPVKDCPECKGTGYYESPLTAKRSPCSLGCKQ